MTDLITLVADRDMEQTIQGLMTRSQSLGVRAVEYEIFIHDKHDPGCCNEAHNFLRPYSSHYKYALVLFDYEGSGKEKNTFI